MDSVRVAVVGVSGRGRGLLGLLLGMPDVEVIGVSDLYEDRLARAKQDVIEKRGNTPMASTDFRRLLEMKELDAVITPSSWTSHADVCIASMDAGKYAATEVELREHLAVFRARMAVSYVTGADLIAAGFQPGNAFHEALDYAHRLQLSGVDRKSTLSQTLVFLRSREG